MLVLPNHNRRGAVLPLMALLLPVMLTMCLFAINVAYMQLTRSELQVATDAAARAGGRALSEFQSVDRAREFVVGAAAANNVAGQPLIIDSKSSTGEIQFGTAAREGGTGRFVFQPLGPGELNGLRLAANSVLVTGRRNAGSLSGSVNLLMNGVANRNVFDPVSTSVCTQTDRDIILLLDQSGSMLFHQDWPVSYGGAYRGNQKWAGEQMAEYKLQGGFDPVTGKWKDAAWKQKWEDMNSFKTTFEKYLGFVPKEPGEVVPVPPFSRWYAAMNGLNVMLDYLEKTDPEEQVAVITFSHLTNVHIDLTKDYTLIREWTRTHRIGGNTYPGRGLLATYDLFKQSPNVRPAASKSVLLVGDGSGYDESVDDGIAALVGIDSPIYAMSMFDVGGYTQLDYIAKKGGGVHYIAPQSSDIVRAYSEFAETSPSFLTQ